MKVNHAEANAMAEGETMKLELVIQPRYETVNRTRRGTSLFQRMYEKLARASLMDADAVFKSKDWPYLWQR